jgi:hypothetical protein
MTIGPDTSMTFRDAILRVAEAAGLADNVNAATVGIPTDTGDLDIVKRAVWDGAELFYRGLNPATGKVHPWTFLRPMVELICDPAGTGPDNIENDPAKMRLPWNVTGRPSGTWVWKVASGGWGGNVIDTHIERLERMHVLGTITGCPEYAAIGVAKDQKVNVTDRQGWYVHVYPTPDLAYVMRARFLLTPRKLLELDDRHIAGALHDQTLVSAAVWAFKRRDAKDRATRESYREDFEEAMLASIKHDEMNVPKTLGRLEDPSLCGDDEEQDYARNAITVNGVQVYP